VVGGHVMGRTSFLVVKDSEDLLDLLPFWLDQQKPGYTL
jgi:hypothetical protein